MWKRVGSLYDTPTGIELGIMRHGTPNTVSHISYIICQHAQRKWTIQKNVIRRITKKKEMRKYEARNMDEKMDLLRNL